MYNLILADNNYWLSTADKDNGLTINPVLLDQDFITLTNINNDDSVINVYDIKFKTFVKKADKLDYLASTFSGALSYAIHHFITGKKKNDVNLDNIQLEDIKVLSAKLLCFYNYSNSQISEAQKKIDEVICDVADKTKKATKYKKLTVDFARGISYKALLMSIFTSILDIEIGKDKDGKLIINKIEDSEIIGKTLFKKVQIGFIKWLITTTVDYKKTGKFKEEVDDVFKVHGGLIKLKDIIIELSSTKFFNNKDFDESKLIKYFIRETNSTKETNDEECDFSKTIAKQTIPIIFNKAFVRSYYFIKTFINEVNLHETKTLEGLEVLELSKLYRRDSRVIARMDTVSTTVFAALDIIPSTVTAIKAGYKSFETNYVPSQDEKVAMVNATVAATKALKETVNVFASTVNFANIGEFITVIKIDKDYLIEDIKNIFDKTKLVEIKKDSSYVELTDSQISKTLGLNITETKILYSIELDIVNTDIRNTKKSEIQTKKNNWKKQWIEICEKTLGINKLFQEDREKLYSTIKTHRTTENDLWLYKLLIELKSFKPYCQIDNDNKKYKGLKLVDDKYIENIFCKENDVFEEDVCSKISGLYKKNYSYISGNNIKTGAIIAGAAFLTVSTAGAALAFAPAIAVSLVGGSFVGLSGAALTSASLALVGGGSIAAGGLGMTGGVAIIAGGGALIGLGTSGATAAAFAMMSSSSFVLEDNSKLLTKCNILLNIYNMRNEVFNIRDQLIETRNNTRTRLNVLKDTIVIDEKNKKERNGLIKEQEKSVSIIEKTINSLDKLIIDYDKNKSF